MNESAPLPAKLPRVTSWPEWELGRAARRALAMQITGGKTLRRLRGNPRKDALLRLVYAGDRGLPFAHKERRFSTAEQTKSAVAETAAP